MAEKKFRGKTLTSFTIIWGFIILAFTGVILYFTPAGRIANWTNWTLLGLTKDEWQNIHTVFACLFVICAAFHIFFNWRVILSYFKTKMSEGMQRKKELSIATLLTIFFVLGSYYEWQPFSTLFEWREVFKNQEQLIKSSTVVPHMEEMTIEEIAEYTTRTKDEIIQIIRDKGYKLADENRLFGEIAEDNGKSPDALFNEITGKSGSGRGAGQGGGRKGDGELEGADAEHEQQEARGGGSGSGFGRMSLEDLCKQAGITVDEAIKNLKGNNIEVSSTDKIRDIANKLGVRPSEVLDYIKK